MADGAQYDELEESEDVQVDVDYGPLPNQPAVVEASVNPPECDTSKLHKHAMGWFDIFIVCCVSTINQLIFKSWFVFSRFITDEYHISFYELSLSLAVIQLSVIPTLFVVPSLNSWKSNYLCFVLQIIPMGCVIAQSLLPGSFFNIFVLSTIRTFVGQLMWTLSNSICFHFMLEPKGQDPWKKNTATTLFMGTWTYSTFLFLAVGPVIDHYGFRYAMLVSGIVNAVGAVVLFFRMPSISIHEFIELERAAAGPSPADKEAVGEEDTGCNSEVFANLKVVFRDIVAVLIFLNVMTAVCNWGSYYGSFGPWLTDLFDLNAQRLGQYATICEAMAEIISLCLIPIISKRVSNSTLCVIGGLCETTSVVLLNVILWNSEDILNNVIMQLEQEWMRIGCVLFIIFLFYAGHETLYIALMVSLEFIPSKQYSTAVALFSVFDYLGGFVGQSFVTYVFEHRGISAMAPIMFVVECLSITCLILVYLIQRYRKTKGKRKKIMKHHHADQSIQSIADGTGYRNGSINNGSSANGSLLNGSSVNGSSHVNGSSNKQRLRYRSDSDSLSSDDKSALDESMISRYRTQTESRYSLLSEDGK